MSDPMKQQPPLPLLGLTDCVTSATARTLPHTQGLHLCFHFHPTLKRGKEKDHAIVYKYEPAVKHIIYYIHLKRVQDSTFY